MTFCGYCGKEVLPPEPGEDSIIGGSSHYWCVEHRRQWDVQTGDDTLSEQNYCSESGISLGNLVAEAKIS